MVGDISVGGVHQPCGMPNMAIRGWGMKKKKKFIELTKRFEECYDEVKSIALRLRR